jgi:hypothetical protein
VPRAGWPDPGQPKLAIEIPVGERSSKTFCPEPWPEVIEFGASVPHLMKANAGALVPARGVVVAEVIAVVGVGVGSETTVGGVCDLAAYRTATPATRTNKTTERVARLRRVVTRAPVHSLAAAA